MRALLEAQNKIAGGQEAFIPFVEVPFPQETNGSRESSRGLRGYLGKSAMKHAMLPLFPIRG